MGKVTWLLAVCNANANNNVMAHPMHATSCSCAV
eukprot:CAMPEP_0202904324 /NCGR_PEP_ID=MMETSP1392-20130828/28821_1 /ASSEMBLY_ACC=CAM_ASM_000868 /TAXON_ID=225041 /ORGANISM="Chlamydomonas chlamydogama, Strain SAG 11-48b" /LENGTH=33 /DNA_ID= /DNA_START= /DNA_END= /DNA_ORIENTATION=